MNSSDDSYQDKIIKLMLQNLISDGSLESVIKDVKILVNKNLDEIETKDKLPLSNYDILSIILKSVGSVKLLKCLLAIGDEKKSKAKHPKAKIKKEKFLIAHKLKFSKKKMEKEKEIEKKEEINAKNIECSYYTGNIRVDIDKRNKKDNFVIEINNDNDAKKSNNIINLDESESSTSGENYINIGVKSEVKEFRQKNDVSNELKKKKVSLHNGINSEIKISLPTKENKKGKENELSTHYSIDNGSLFKYQFDKINKEENLAYFSCADENCECKAEYDIKNCLFAIKVGHSYENQCHSYIINKNKKDKRWHNYMIEKNYTQLQLRKEDDLE